MEIVGLQPTTMSCFALQVVRTTDNRDRFNACDVLFYLALTGFHVVPNAPHGSHSRHQAVGIPLETAPWALLYEPTEKETGRVLY